MVRNVIKVYSRPPRKNKIRIYSKNTSLGAAFAKRFNRTSRDLPKQLVFEKADGNWTDVLSTIKKTI